MIGKLPFLTVGLLTRRYLPCGVVIANFLWCSIQPGAFQTAFRLISSTGQLIRRQFFHCWNQNVASRQTL